jgi:hypothetical protein
MSDVVNNPEDPYYDEPDAHQIVEDFGEYHHNDTEDKGDDSRYEAHVRQGYRSQIIHLLSPPITEL